jgi:hypothetical protein
MTKGVPEAMERDQNLGTEPVGMVDVSEAEAAADVEDTAAEGGGNERDKASVKRPRESQAGAGEESQQAEGMEVEEI